MARFINNPEEEYNMNMHALLPIKIVLIRLPPGADLYFRKNTPAELNSKNKHGCLFFSYYSCGVHVWGANLFAGPSLADRERHLEN